MSAPVVPAFSHPTRRNVVCIDAANEQTSVATYISSDSVVLLVPPADVRLLTPDDARALADDLCELAAAVDIAQMGQDCEFVQSMLRRA